MSKAEVLFDGKPLKTIEDLQKFFEALGELSTQIQPEFMKQLPDDPIIIFSYKVTALLGEAINPKASVSAVAWTQTALILMLVAQGRLTFKFVADQPEFNMAEIFTEVNDILEGKLP